MAQKRRGRPPGSKNKPKDGTATPARRGRPPGSKNKTSTTGAKRGRPPKAATPARRGRKKAIENMTMAELAAELQSVEGERDAIVEQRDSFDEALAASDMRANQLRSALLALVNHTVGGDAEDDGASGEQQGELDGVDPTDPPTGRDGKVLHGAAAAAAARKASANGSSATAQA